MEAGKLKARRPCSKGARAYLRRRLRFFFGAAPASPAGSSGGTGAPIRRSPSYSTTLTALAEVQQMSERAFTSAELLM